MKIGSITNVQDHAVISTVPSLESGFPAKVDIGNHVTIGASSLVLFSNQSICQVSDRGYMIRA